MHTKAPLPVTLLSGQKTLPIIEAYFEFNHLKHLYRQGWLRHGIEKKYCESVAEHSFCVALLALFLADEYHIELDKTKVIRMALIHDLGEVYVGDFTPQDIIERSQKYQLEKQSISQVLSKLPNGSKWIALWEEYEKRESAESQFVHQVHLLELALQASVYEHLELGNLSVFFESANQALSADELKFITNALEKLRK
ncbi:HD domain-containing protein [Scytonema tolypothrichoides VB-61278]|nr:HD domain-containing protein [Scytonema tolypothrichoides VB-61278]